MIKKCLALLFFLGFSFNAYASTQATTKLTALLQDLQTMQANFNQTISDGHGNVIQQSNGNMALQRPGLFRWDTSHPNQQLIIADGKTIWIYDKDLQQVTKEIQNGSNNSPGLLLSDSVDQLAKRFSVQTLKTDDDSQEFRLTPTRKDLFKSVELLFSNNGQLQQMNMIDNLGQTTEIVFTNVSINYHLSPDLFQFQVPKGVDVVSAQ